MFARVSWISIAACIATLAVPAFAEVKVGDKAIEIEAKSIVNSPIKKLKELRRSLVLYEYFAFW